MRPELFEIPFIYLTVKSYGLMMVVGFLSAVALIRHLSRDITPSPHLITNAALYSLIAGVVGARVFYVLHHFDQFSENLPSVFAIWNGGLELLGGVILAITIIFFYLWYHKLPIRQYLDILAIGLMLALAFGRIGCFLNGCCFGKPTRLPWGVHFPYGSFAYHSQIYPDPERNRPDPHLELPAEYFDYAERFFSVELAFQSELDNGMVSKDLRSEFKNNRISLSRYARVSIEEKGMRWLITDRANKYNVAKSTARLDIYGKINYLKRYDDLTEAQKAEVAYGKYRCLSVHPTQLYSSANAAFLCLILYLFWRRAKTLQNSKDAAKLCIQPGCTFALMFIVYGITRFFIEFLRDDNPFEFDSMTISQVISAVLIVAGGGLMLIFQKIKPRSISS
jgi:prolipoprotein diacylglyceryltransferase